MALRLDYEKNEDAVLQKKYESQSVNCKTRSTGV